MLFLAGARLRYVVLLTLVALLAFGVLAVTSAYRLRRITGFIDPWASPYGSGFQLTQSLIAIGRGKWFGVGLGNSVQKLFYLPEAHTDFLFAVLAEELGLAGVLLTIGLFVGLIWRAFHIASLAARAGLTFQRLLAAGFGLWLGMQTFINIGVNMGVLPLQFADGESAESLGLDGTETFDIAVDDSLQPRQRVKVTATARDGSTREFEAIARVDTPIEIEYLRNGGILHYVLRRMAAA